MHACQWWSRSQRVPFPDQLLRFADHVVPVVQLSASGIHERSDDHHPQRHCKMHQHFILHVGYYNVKWGKMSITYLFACLLILQGILYAWCVLHFYRVLHNVSLPTRLSVKIIDRNVPGSSVIGCWSSRDRQPVSSCMGKSLKVSLSLKDGLIPLATVVHLFLTTWVCIFKETWTHTPDPPIIQSSP